MTRAEVLQEVRLMKFEEVYTRRTAGKLTQEQAAEILGVSVRTVRRWEDRYEADGAEGLYDRRLGKLANNRVPTDTAMEMLTLFDSTYWDYSPRHFHEKLVTQHGFTRSYNWVRLTLQSHGRVQSAPRRVLKHITGPMGQSEEVRKGWYAHWVREGFTALERQLAQHTVHGPFCIGNSPTLADICLVPQVLNARRFGVPIDDFQRINAITAHCNTLAAFQAAAAQTD